MTTVVVSAEGRIALPAALPVGTLGRLGLATGARLEVIDEHDGLRLRVLHPVAVEDVTHLAGMVKLDALGVPRRLDDFDPATLLADERPG